MPHALIVHILTRYLILLCAIILLLQTVAVSKINSPSDDEIFFTKKKVLTNRLRKCSHKKVTLDEN